MGGISSKRGHRRGVLSPSAKVISDGSKMPFVPSTASSRIRVDSIETIVMGRERPVSIHSSKEATLRSQMTKKCPKSKLSPR